MDKRNVVLVTADSVRADHCGFLNDRVDTTQFLDRAAEKGAVFTDAIAPGPRTPSSMPEIFTGEPLPIPEDDMTDWESRTARIGTHLARHETIPERFKEMGYTTAAYTANPFTNESMNYDEGFDEFNEIRHESTKSLLNRFSGTRLKPLVYLSQWLNKDNWFSQWPTFYDRLLETVEQLEEPYFLWVFLLDTHTPYVVPRQDRKKSSTLGMYSAVFKSSSVFGEQSDNTYMQKDLPSETEKRIRCAYQDTIRSVDRFMRSLDEDLQEDDPVFVFHSDHGEAFNEHGTYGHQSQLYEENIRVPLLIYNAGFDTEITEQVSLRSLPWILELCSDCERLPESDVSSEYVFSKTETGDAIAARSYPLKCIATGDSKTVYDLRSDPEERSPLGTDHNDSVRDLVSALESHKRALTKRDTGSMEKQPLDSDIKNRLKSLGYRE